MPVIDKKQSQVAMKKQKTQSQKKRHGQHHSNTKKYRSSYWPYIPILLLIAGMFMLAVVRSPGPTNVLAFATEMSADGLLEATNQRRSAEDSHALTLNTRLSEAAQAKAEDMARRNYWSHETPEGDQPWIFIDAVDYRYMKAGENLAYGFLTSSQAINGWMNSPSHRNNMLDNSFTEVGFGFVNALDYQSSDAETLVVALYAQPHATNGEAGNEGSDTNSQETIISMRVPENNQEVQAITRLESIIGDRFAWATFSLGIVSGGAASGLLLSNGIRLRRFLKRGKNFVMHHPLLDVSLVSLLILAAFLADHVGYII